jgi:hypothetical protein
MRACAQRGSSGGAHCGDMSLAIWRHDLVWPGGTRGGPGWCRWHGARGGECVLGVLPRDTDRRPPRSILVLLLAVDAHRKNTWVDGDMLRSLRGLSDLLQLSHLRFEPQPLCSFIRRQRPPPCLMFGRRHLSARLLLEVREGIRRQLLPVLLLLLLRHR